MTYYSLNWVGGGIYTQQTFKIISVSAFIKGTGPFKMPLCFSLKLVCNLSFSSSSYQNSSFQNSSLKLPCLPPKLSPIIYPIGPPAAKTAAEDFSCPSRSWSPLYLWVAAFSWLWLLLKRAGEQVEENSFKSPISTKMLIKQSPKQPACTPVCLGPQLPAPAPFRNWAGPFQLRKKNLAKGWDEIGILTSGAQVGNNNSGDIQSI